VNSRKLGAIEDKAVTPLRSSPQSKTLARSSLILTVILIANLLICPQLQAAPGYRDGVLLVKWQDGPESYAAAAGNAVIGSTVKRNFNAIGWQHVRLPEGMSVRDGMEAYRALGTVLAVEPDGTIEPILPPVVGRAVPSAPRERGDAATNRKSI